MSLRVGLLAQLSRFDDDAWTALANRGLLRRARKDLAGAAPEVVTDEAEVFEIRIAPYVVRFDAQGPAGAACDCQSGSVCRHILVAGLWLLSTAAAETTAGAEVPAETPAAELLTIDPEALTAYAGRAGYRWALRYVDDLDLESDVRVEEDRQVVIALSSPRVTFRFMGGGVAGLVPDTRLPAIEKYQAAAVIVYQRMAGVGPAPEAAKTQTDKGSQTGRSARLAASRLRLRTAAQQLLTDTVRLGISHLSRSVHERYETLATWAQGAEYYRLALLLRRLADHVDLLLDRSARADEHRLLDEAAVAYALVCALNKSEQPRLVGQARNRYDMVRRLDVIGLGAFPWRTGSGYQGLTALFWWPAESRFLSWTDARPEVMRTFEPRHRYASPGPWAGLGSPAELTGATVTLNDARLSPTGRLSGAEQTRATAKPLAGTAIAAALPAVSHWSDLAKRPPRSLLDTPDPLDDWVVLHPSAFRRPRFDPVRQLLEWDVVDDAESVLSHQLPFTAANQHAIDRAEALGEQDLPDGTLLVSRVHRTAAGLVGEPMSLVRPDLGPGSAVDPLHFGKAVPRSRGAEPASGDPAVAIWLPPQLDDLRTWLTTHAERGTGAAAAGSLNAALASRHRAVRDIGFGVFPDPAGEDPAVGILRSCYLLQQTVRVLTGRTG
ncbi:hypothetical protein GCM10009789_46950 [Kribbella sancticallisti]|uniref:SWIM-type domain-containing protein n=1 Tax=Kribbella sancticallisti TaxID=460087 RepID=A0ABN2DYK5_9ACTN